MSFKGLSGEDKSKLEFEVVSQQVRLKLTRFLRYATAHESEEAQIILQNKAINIARNVLGKPLYVLEADNLGDYQLVEFAWHYGEIEVLMQRPNTIELVETIADLIQNDVLNEDDVTN